MFRRPLVIAILFLGLSQNDALAQFMNRTPVRVVPVPSFNRSAPIGPHVVPMQHIPMQSVPNLHVHQHFVPFGPPQPITPHFVPQPAAFPNVVIRPFNALPNSFPTPAPAFNPSANRRTLIGGLVPPPMVPARQFDPFYHQGVIQSPTYANTAGQPSTAPQADIADTQRNTPTSREQSVQPTNVDAKSDNTQTKFVDVEAPPKPPKELADLINRGESAILNKPTHINDVAVSDDVAFPADQEESVSDEDVWSMDDWNTDEPQDEQATPTNPANVAADETAIPQDPATNDLLDTEASTDSKQLATKTDESTDWAQEEWADEDWAKEDSSPSEDWATEEWANEGQVDADVQDIATAPSDTSADTGAQDIASSDSTDNVRNLDASTIAPPSDEVAQKEDWAKEDWAKEDWAQEDWANEDWAKEELAQNDSDAGELAHELGLTADDSNTVVADSPAGEEDVWATESGDTAEDWTQENWVNEDWAKEELEKASLAQEQESTSDQQASISVPDEVDEWAAEGNDDWAHTDDEWSNEQTAVVADATQETVAQTQVAEESQTTEATQQIAEKGVVAANTTKPTQQAGWFDWRWILALAPILGITAAWFLRKRRQAQAAAFLRPAAAALPQPNAQERRASAERTAAPVAAAPAANQQKTQPVPVPPTPSDDLTRLRGVSAPISSLLNALGIQTYQKLAESNANDLRAVIAKGGLEGKVADPAVWVYQAGFAVRNDWNGLAEWQAGNEQLFQTSIQVDQKQAEAQTSDLTKIHGIDATLAKHLAGKGIINFQQLAAIDRRDLRVLLSDAGPNYANADTNSWPGLAALASRGDWEKFQQLDSALEQGLLDTTNSIFESLAGSAAPQATPKDSDTKTSPV